MKFRIIFVAFLFLFISSFNIVSADTKTENETRDLTIKLWSEKLHGGRLNTNRFFIENRFQNKPLSYDYFLIALAAKSGDISCIKRDEPLKDFEALCLQERFKVSGYTWGKRAQTVSRKSYLEKFNFGTIYTRQGAPRLLDALNGFFASQVNQDSKLTDEEVKLPEVDTSIKKIMMDFENQFFGVNFKYTSNFEKISLSKLPKQFYGNGKFISAFIPKDNVDSLDKDYITVYLQEFDEDDQVTTLSHVREKAIKDERYKALSKIVNIGSIKALEFIDRRISNNKTPFTHGIYIINDSRVLVFTYHGLNFNSKYYNEIYEFVKTAKIDTKDSLTYINKTFEDSKIGISFEHPENFEVLNVSSVDNLLKNNPYLYHLNSLTRQYEVLYVKPWYKENLRTYPLLVTVEKDINTTFDQASYLEDLKIALGLYNNVKISKEGAYYSGKTKMYELQYTLTNKLNSNLNFDIVHRIVANNFKIVSIIQAIPKTSKVDFKDEFEEVTKTLKIK